MLKADRSRPYFIFLLGLLLALLVAYLVLSFIAPNQLQQLGSGLHRTGPVKPVILATADVSGYYQLLGERIREEMREGKVVVKPSQGTLANLDALQTGEVDLAFVQGGLDVDRSDGLVGLAAMSWQYVHVVVHADSPMQEFRDLAGKNVALGPKKSGNTILGTRVFKYFWPDGGVNLLHTKLADIPADLASGKLDGAFVVYDFHAPYIEKLLANGQYRLLPIPQAEALAYSLPGVHAATIPIGSYGPNRTIPEQEPLPTVKVKTLLVTRKDTSPYVVENILRVIYSSRFIKKAGLALFTEEFGRGLDELPMHDAAARFYRRNDPISSDMFEIGSAFLAALLFLGSIFSYLNTKAHERHTEKLRRRIVPYFKELLGSTEHVGTSRSIDELRDVLQKMMNTQRKAEDEWLAGRLDTEHMENLYVIYGIRCQNVSNKIIQRLMEQESKRDEEQET